MAIMHVPAMSVRVSLRVNVLDTLYWNHIMPYPSKGRMLAWEYLVQPLHRVGRINKQLMGRFFYSSENLNH